MCLSIPAEIMSVNGQMADVSIGGAIQKASVQLIEDPKPGDFVLLHTGFAIERISKDEAEEMIRMLKELSIDDNELQSS